MDEFIAGLIPHADVLTGGEQPDRPYESGGNTNASNHSTLQGNHAYSHCPVMSLRTQPSHIATENLPTKIWVVTKLDTPKSDYPERTELGLSLVLTLKLKLTTRFQSFLGNLISPQSERRSFSAAMWDACIRRLSNHRRGIRWRDVN